MTNTIIDNKFREFMNRMIGPFVDVNNHPKDLQEAIRYLSYYYDRTFRLEESLQTIIAQSHSWVIIEATAHTLAPIHQKYREIAQKALVEK